MRMCTSFVIVKPLNFIVNNGLIGLIYSTSTHPFSVAPMK